MFSNRGRFSNIPGFRIFSFQCCQSKSLASSFWSEKILFRGRNYKEMAMSWSWFDWEQQSHHGDTLKQKAFSKSCRQHGQHILLLEKALNFYTFCSFYDELLSKTKLRGFHVWIELENSCFFLEKICQLGSQAGVVDINHAFHLYYKITLYVDWVSVDLNLTSRISSGHSGFLPPQKKLTPSLFQFKRMQDLPENHFRVSGASWVKYYYYILLLLLYYYY